MGFRHSRGITVKQSFEYSKNTFGRIYYLANSNLCSALKEWKGTEECLGFLADEQSMLHGVYPVLQTAQEETPKVVTLYKRLDSPHISNARLTRKECLNLVLTLASSVLQLHDPVVEREMGKG
jgi:hypothetical protein